MELWLLLIVFLVCVLFLMTVLIMGICTKLTAWCTGADLSSEDAPFDPDDAEDGDADQDDAHWIVQVAAGQRQQ